MKFEKIIKNFKYLLFNKNFNKIIYLFILLLILFIPIKQIYDNKLNSNYLNIQKNINLNFNKKLKKKIKIGLYCRSIKNGGIERIVSMLLNYLDRLSIFNIYLFTKINKENNEYIIPKNITRIVVRNNIVKKVLKENIDILIYNLNNEDEIKILNNLKKPKTIFYIHQCFLLWIYRKNYNKINIYKAYKSAKYVISLVPFENDYLFKKWGICSILMNNFISYNYKSVIPSNLSSKTILMIGRATDSMKRFKLGIKVMKYIVKEIPESRMIIISSIKKNSFIQYFTKKLKIEKNVKFVGYSSKPEIYFKNASLHIFPSICESFGLVVGETKMYGIPNILIGIDYISIVKGGTVIIYDDNPEIISKEAIKILKNDKYRKKLGKEARKSMIKINNTLIFTKWIKLILSIYNGDKYYQRLREYDEKISENSAVNILRNQLNLLKKRIKNFESITTQNLENFTFVQNLVNYMKPFIK